MYTKIAATIVGMVLLKFFLVGSAPEPSSATPATEAPTNVAATSFDALDERSQWSLDFLAALGNQSPSWEIMGFVNSWQQGEGTAAKYNPLATTQDMHVEGQECFNYLSGRCGVKSYPDRQTGIDANVATVTNGYYPHILNGLLTNNPEEALNDEELGTWGTGGGAVRRNYKEWLDAFPAPAQEVPASSTGVAGAAISAERQALVEEALALQGIPYVRGGRSASGGDCSGTMQYIFKTVVSIDIGGTTFSQQDNPALRSIDETQIRPGDLWYGQYSDDQHTGMVADVDNDGHWDLINNGGHTMDMHVDYNFLTDPYFSEHTMGYRNALGD